MRQVVNLQNKVAVAPNALLSVPLGAYLLHLSLADENGVRCNFLFFLDMTLSKAFRCTTTVHIETQLSSNLEICTHFTESST